MCSLTGVLQIGMPSDAPLVKAIAGATSKNEDCSAI